MLLVCGSFNTIAIHSTCNCLIQTHITILFPCFCNDICMTSFCHVAGSWRIVRSGWFIARTPQHTKTTHSTAAHKLHESIFVLWRSSHRILFVVKVHTKKGWWGLCAFCTFFTFPKISQHNTNYYIRYFAHEQNCLILDCSAVIQWEEEGRGGVFDLETVCCSHLNIESYASSFPIFFLCINFQKTTTFTYFCSANETADVFVRFTLSTDNPPHTNKKEPHRQKALY